MKGSLPVCHLLAFAGAALLLSPLAPAARGDAFVIPHLLETKGRATQTAFTFDTAIHAVYSGGRGGIPNGGGATVKLYLFDQATGLPMVGAANTEVCNPCTYNLSPQSPEITLPLEDQIQTLGGGFDQDMKQGFAVVDVTGPDPGNVHLETTVVNSHTGPADVALFGYKAERILDNAATNRATIARTLVFPHLLEAKGSIADTMLGLDTTIYAAYAGGLGGITSGNGAVLDVYLYDAATSQPMTGSSGATICAPCSFNLGTGAPSESPRSLSIRLEDLIESQGGGFDQESKAGLGLMVVRGADPGAVAVQTFVSNSHSGPRDLSVFAYTPEEIPLNPGVSSSPRTYFIPHVLETSGETGLDPNSFDTTLYATYRGGLAGQTNTSGATLELFLFDSATGQPLLGQDAKEVCNPCDFSLATGLNGASPRAQTISLDELLAEHGGLASSFLNGFARVVVGGADPADVNLMSFVSHSHSDPLDLSVFGFHPKELAGPQVPPLARTYVIPHILETSGSAEETTNTFDTTVEAAYLPSPGAGSNDLGATLELNLFDQNDGFPMQGKTGAICAPCTFSFGPSNSVQNLNLDHLITSRGGGFDAPRKEGFALLAVGGADPGGIALETFIVNSHSSPLDVSVFGFEPQPAGAKAGILPFQFLAPGLGSVLSIGQPLLVRLAGNRPDIWTTLTASFSADGGNTFVHDVARLPATQDTFYFTPPYDVPTSNAVLQVVARDELGIVTSVQSHPFTVQRPPTNKSRYQTVLTFGPPPADEVAPPQNLQARTSPLTSGAGFFSLPLAANNPSGLLGYNIYRASLMPGQSNVPSASAILANPSNLVASVSADAILFTEVVRLGFEENVIYSLQTVYQDGALSGGSQTVSPAIPFGLHSVWNGNDFTLQFQSALNQDYIIEYKDSLDDDSWTVLDQVRGDGLIHSVTETVAGTGRRFFRVRTP